MPRPSRPQRRRRVGGGGAGRGGGRGGGRVMGSRGGGNGRAYPAAVPPSPAALWVSYELCRGRGLCGDSTAGGGADHASGARDARQRYGGGADSAAAAAGGVRTLRPSRVRGLCGDSSAGVLTLRRGRGRRGGSRAGSAAVTCGDEGYGGDEGWLRIASGARIVRRRYGGGGGGGDCGPHRGCGLCGRGGFADLASGSRTPWREQSWQRRRHLRR
jgi:hypothetical protein